jgi:hypothetical protein
MRDGSPAEALPRRHSAPEDALVNRISNFKLKVQIRTRKWALSGARKTRDTP